MAVAFIGVELMQSRTQATLKVGESVSCGDFTLTYEDMTSVDIEDERNISTATLSVMKGSRTVGAIYPQRQLDYRSMQMFELPGIRRSLEEDIYAAVVEGMPFTAEEATFKIYQNPLKEKICGIRVNLCPKKLFFSIKSILMAWGVQRRTPR